MLTRSDTILKYIVEYFVKNAEPIGSHTLIEEYRLPYSSATIRNEMALLEKMGYIEKTHSSSGRVPSTKGYRYYCEHLRDKTIDDEFKNSLQTVFSERVASIEDVIKSSCEILSQMTSLVSVVHGPDENQEKLASVSLVPISNNTITAVFVTDKGYVENKTFIVQDSINANEVVECMKMLNERLKGTPVTQLVEKMNALKPILSEHIVFHDVIYRAFMETFLRFANDRLSLYGREEIFNNPEFVNDTDKLKRVFKLLNDSSVFKEADEELKDERTTSIHIGDISDNSDISMVTKKFRFGKNGETSITLLGPTRMDYDKAITALEYISEELDKYFDDEEEGDDDSVC